VSVEPPVATTSEAAQGDISDGASPATVTVPLPVISEPTYFFPVQPTADATYSHDHHDYPAADIFAPCGTEVVAVTDGQIAEASLTDNWTSALNDGATRGGLSVTLAGDDGVRYYGSHLDSIAPGLSIGDRVVAGSLLGEVGATGNAVGIACHLHFGISPLCGVGDWAVRRGVVAPWSYLDAWQRGEDMSPTEDVAAWIPASPQSCEPD